MNTFSFKRITLALWVLMSFLMISCNRDEAPPQPTNESGTLGHDQWGKVEMIFREGHLHGASFHGNPEIKGSPLKRIQKMYFELDNNKNIVRKNEAGKILKPGEEPIVIARHEMNYSLEIIYYDKQGKRINYQFTTKEMLPIHQHFFTTKEYVKWGSDKPVAEDLGNILTYTYRDTNPDHVMVGDFVPGTTQASVLSNDAVGLKGYFGTKNISGVKFNMNISLYHVMKGNKYTNNGKTWPFNAPSAGLSSVSVPDFSQSIPIEILPDYSDGTDAGFEKYLRMLAKYYNVTYEFIKEVEGNTGIDESGAFWM